MNPKITFKKDDEKEISNILKAIASKDKQVSEAAQTTFAAFVGPVVDTVLNQAATSNYVFSTETYAMGDGAPSIPIDTYFDNIEGLFQVWSSALPGGLPSNMAWGASEYRFTTWELESAAHMLKSYAEKSRLNVVAKTIERLAQEVLAKQEYQLWSIVLGALAQVRTNGVAHVVDASTGGTFKIADLNSLWTRVKRLRKSWLGGTPTTTVGRGLTDLFCSVEVMEDIRSMAYNPVNTVAGVTDTTGTEAGSTVGIPLPDAMRQEIFRNAGMSEIFGVRLHELLELGVGQSYNQLFDDLYTASGSDPSFSASTDELVLGVDLSVPSAIKIVATDSDTGAQFQASPDDQWVSRSKKFGWYGAVEMGAIVVDNKALAGIIV